MAKESPYKDSIHLPKTPFAMKAELAKREPELLARWEKEGLYQALRAQRKGKPRYVLHDGPPYANGDIHMGHALNKVLKDFLLKYKSLRGFDTPYVPGWDCHGLPVEHQLFKELGKTKHEVDQVAFRKQAQQYAARFVGIQRDQFKRLGIFGDWENPYLTMSKDYEAAIVESLSRLLSDGYIYQGTRPIHWCIHCETALAEAELEYADHESYSITVRFDVTWLPARLRGQFPDLRNEKILIWTTTPWTLPANLAVAVKPDFKYAIVRVDTNGAQEDWIIAEELVEKNLALAEIKKHTVLGTVLGENLEGTHYKHPFLEREPESQVLLSDFVTLDQGTGCVHIAPGHGEEDHEVGLRYGLPALSPVNDRGLLTKEAGPFAGMHVFKANRPITDHLKASGALLQEGKINHSYPHCWRCQNPVIFRATPQWFIRIDHRDLRSAALSDIAKTQWVPPKGQNRIASMVEGRPDWCLSRQRLWGVPIPALRCADCGEPRLTQAMMQKFLAEVKQHGTDSWFTQEPAHWLEPGAACAKCKSTRFKREHDIVDVWFDSGVSHQAVLRRRPELAYPADLYLEGSDQHRGWFQSALLTAVPLEKKAPFKTVLTHGFVTDGEGKKMSKSAGNVIAPSQIVDKHGADVLRLWVSCVDYTDDVRLSGAIVDQVSDSYRKIRNTLRFLLGNLFDFDPKADAVPHASMGELDRWALRQLFRLVQETQEAYDRFEFYKVYRAMYQFCVVTMSAFYLDILKDRLYTSHASDPKRRSAQTALWEIARALTVIASPILAFTAEEAWQLLREKQAGAKASVHMEDWPALPKAFGQDAGAGDTWDRLLGVREEVLKILEVARQDKAIGSGLEACVILHAEEPSLTALLKKYKADLPSVFIVSQVDLCDDRNKLDALTGSAIIPGLRIGVEKARGHKCQRCWIYSPAVGSHAAHPALCERCVSVMEKISAKVV